VPFDHALSAVGLTPRTGLARDAALEVQAGIVVDRLLRTSDPAIFALGDCAQTEAGPLPFIAPLLAEARALAATLVGTETPLRLPAMPVVVKTPALPIVVCPPKPGTDGAWVLDVLEKHAAVAVFRTPDGTEAGFALAGAKTGLQQAMAQRMPDLLPAAADAPGPAPVGAAGADAGDRYECNICGYIYDPEHGDPDGGIAPGTRWEDIPEDWICPTCGAGKEHFTPVA
jgi:rubredoxin